MQGVHGFSRFVGLAVGGVISLVSSVALADADADGADPAVRLAFAESTLRTESEAAHRSRLLVSGLGIGLGGATVGVAGVLLAREVTPGAVVLVVQGSLVVGAGTYGLFWRRDPFEELQATLIGAKAIGAPAASVRAFEQRWYELAGRERQWRHIEGAASSVLGGGLLAAAVIVAATPGDVDPTTRGLYTRTLLGSGVALLGAGLGKLLVPSAVERAYSAFAGSTRAATFRISPLPGGTGLAFGARF